jgi:hypothetical protein
VGVRPVTRDTLMGAKPVAMRKYWSNKTRRGRENITYLRQHANDRAFYVHARLLL